MTVIATKINITSQILFNNKFKQNQKNDLDYFIFKFHQKRIF